MVTAAVSFYSFVLFVHIAAAIVAFGPAFAYPLLSALAGRSGPAQLAFFHRAQERVGRVLITPAAAVVLVAGIYLAVAGPYGFDEPFVGAGLLIIVAVLGLLGAFFAPQERRLAALADVDAARGGSGPGSPSEDYVLAAARLLAVRMLAAFLILVAVFLMVTKPGT